MTLLTELSDSLADAVETVSKRLARVEARRRYGATGLVWRDDGMVITADHVVQRDDNITVVLPETGEAPARLVGRDPGSDIALLQVDGGVTAIVEPSEREARVGNLVLAVGAAIGDEPMTSFGVVAGRTGPRRGWRRGPIEQIIRSDVTLYPGFSGGPLVDVSGQVLGMNSSTLARGLAATLPWPFVVGVAEALAERGSVRRAYLGVTTQPVEIPQAMREALGLTQAAGVLTLSVEPDSPAEAGGMLIGDIVVRIGEHEIAGIEDLQDALGPGSAGAQQALGVIRGGVLAELHVTIGER